MTFTEVNRIIREEQSLKMAVMTLKEKKDYVSSGAKEIQMKIEQIKLNKTNAEKIIAH